MALSSGTRVGPYEIVAPIGAGGMGEVYRAKDSRLGRDVAVKVLPPDVAGDESRLARFEQEARAASTLNHPNILTIHDIGRENGVAYMVSELLEGETLRDRMAGVALPFRKAVDIAREIAQGLAAAHGRGIVHRDLKPENLFVTKDGRVKILDFGLAKLVNPLSEGPHSAVPTLANKTAPGMVLGTVGYMSPEQVRGEAADHRSDIFSFGTILFEMLTGKRAFRKDTAAETLAAILREEPPELIETNQSLPTGAERIVRHCLEKSPDERFQSARDLAFQLQSLSGTSESTAFGSMVGKRGKSFTGRNAGALALAGVLLSAGSYLLGSRQNRTVPVRYEQLTYRNMIMDSARFLPGGQSILYTAGDPRIVYSALIGSPEIQTTDFPPSFLAAVSKSGKVALLLHTEENFPFLGGTLAEVPTAGGAPREIAENIGAVDWSPDDRLAVVRKHEGKFRVEFPIGQVVYEGASVIALMRLSPDGKWAAFSEHPVRNDDRGTIRVLELATKTAKTVSPDCDSIAGLAWSASGKEVFFSAAIAGAFRELFAATKDGEIRPVLAVPGNLRIEDVAPSGDLLLARFAANAHMLLATEGSGAERELSWLDVSIPADIAPDGKSILFYEGSAGYRAQPSIYVRNVDGSPATRIGEGVPLVFSPDGKSALIFSFDGPPHLEILPIGVGETRKLPGGPIRNVGWARWFPDGQRFVFSANTAESNRYFLFTQGLDGQPPTTLGDIEVRASGHLLSRDGASLLIRRVDGTAVRMPSAGGTAQKIPSIENIDQMLWWSEDGRSIAVIGNVDIEARLDRIDLTTGKRMPWRNMPVSNPRSLRQGAIRLSRDGRSILYSTGGNTTDLFVAHGVR